MSNNVQYWSKYVDQIVMIQLRSQPYIGVTGEDLVPAASEEGFMNTPLLRGIVKSANAVGDSVRVVLETTDPNPAFPDNRVCIDLDAVRDIGYLTTVTRRLITER